MVGLLGICSGASPGASGVEGSERPHEEENTGSTSWLGMVLETPLCLIVLQRCSGRGRCDIHEVVT